MKRLFQLLILATLLIAFSCRHKKRQEEPLPKNHSDTASAPANQSDSTAKTTPPTSTLERDLEAMKDQYHFSDNEVPNFQIHNSSSKPLSVRLDGKHIEIDPSSNVYEHIKNGPHKISYNDVSFTFTLLEKERVLINPFRDSVVMEEVLYKRTINSFSTTAKPEDYKTKFDMVELGGEFYLGPYKVIANQRIVKGWDFGLGERSIRSITRDSELYREDPGTVYTSYYKISTLREIMDSNIPLNRNDDFINIILKKNVHDLKAGYDISSKQANFLVVTSPAGVEIAVGTVTIAGSNDILLTEAYYYDKNEHGKITDQIAVISCFITKDGKRKKVKAGIVLSDGSHQPHIRIIK